MGNKLREIKLPTGEHYGWRFDCPGCDSPHVLSGWTFNNDRLKPTFAPSVLVTYNGADAGKGGPPMRCHSFVREGRIEFLGDCTHELVGQTVDLPDIDATVDT